ncbi:CAAX prenyl protease-related protein [Rugamonas aquatica]|uniref:CAAX prenyl protease-related protein n=1 Tax=Rugamonas aquatica TaxID=2743357 RepID=A0A6A7MYZ7_9BURK|nr:CAAX prenyl protease-related protein [Rugamonas aquatica]
MFSGAAWPRIAPFALYIACIAIADLLGRLGWDAQELRWFYAVKIAAVAAVLLAYRRRYTELTWDGANARSIAIAVASGVLVLVLWINLNADWMQIGSSAGFNPLNHGAIDWALVTVRIVGAALVVPVMEELFWRSFLMRWIDAPDFLTHAPARCSAKAFIVSVILFGVEHNLWLAGVVAGAVYSLLYMRGGRLWSPILAHGVTNGLLGIWIISTGSWTYW